MKSIESFVREVNRGRVVHVEAVMTSNGARTGTDVETIAAGTSVEDAIKIITRRNVEYLSVVDDTKGVIGQVNLQQLACATVAGERGAAGQGTPPEARKLSFAAAPAVK